VSNIINSGASADGEDTSKVKLKSTPKMPALVLLAPDDDASDVVGIYK
jgi:hypothetical protein